MGCARAAGTPGRHALAAMLFAAWAAGARAQCADPVPPSARWKSSVDAISEPFAVDGVGARWVKFLIRTCDPGTVHFQDGTAYPFHAQFATAEVPPFVGMSTSEFDDVSLHAAGQQAILGAVLMPPAGSGSPGEIGIQFVRRDPYPSAEIRDLFGTVRSRVSGAATAFYMPAYEQRAQAEADRAFLSANGIELASPDRWSPGNSCYAKGWALGRLQHVATADIDAAWLAGTLLPSDILLTESVPAEVPPVAGIAALEPCTASSHVAILAGTWGIPFVHLALAEDQDRALGFVGQRIVLRAADRAGSCAVRLIQVDGRVDETSIGELLALKTPQPLDFPPLEPLGAYSAPAAGLRFADASHFGGKASGFGLLRRTIPGSSPVAAAFSFDLWTGYLDQTLTTGRALREEIRQRLAPHAWPPDMAALSSALQGIRQLFTDTAVTSFSPEQQAAILATLQDPQYAFDPLLNLRFRSSTNMEDAARFTGAGLYDSYSGCLADDQDADTSGPSLCDATEAAERGVYRAIRKVFASFYNDNAYLERLRHAVNEDQVGMALLVHHSFPDALEMANGVGTLRVPRGNEADVTLVTQAGAVSVTNPTDGSLPEVVDMYDLGGVPYRSVRQESNLVQLGARVLDWPADYDELVALLGAVSDGYASETGETSYVLDFEYKKLRPDGRLEVKQVRRLPLPSAALSTPFLINEPVRLSVAQGEQGLVLATHRLKSDLQLETLSAWLTDTVLRQGFLTTARHEYTDGCTLLVQDGVVATWPDASHAYDAAAGVSVDAWSLPGLENPRQHRLEIRDVPSQVPDNDPIRVLSDFGYGVPSFSLEATHAADVTSYEYPAWGTTRTDVVTLAPPPAPGPGDLEQLRLIEDLTLGASIVTTFWWPPEPTGPTAGYTAPLVRFERTSISGITTSPLELTSPWSQTYHPYHHNFSEELVFDPRLDPGVTQAQLDELEALGVRGIYAYDPDGAWGTTEGEIRLLTDEMWSNACTGCPGGDADGDGHCAGGALADCDDGNGAVWGTPSEALDLRFVGKDTLAWQPPRAPGGTAVLHDTLRSSSPSDFTAPATCLETDGTDLTTTDAGTPGPGAAWFYLVRAGNSCPAGSGDLGRDSLGRARTAIDCP